MKSRWIAYFFLFGFVSLGFACKGGGDGGGDFLEVVGTGPSDGEQDVPVAVVLGFRVADPIDPATLTADSFFVTDPDGDVMPGAVRVLEDEDTAAALVLEAPLTILTEYTVTVTTALESTRGKRLEQDFQWTFQTIDAEWGEAEWIEPEGLGNSAGTEIGVADDLSALAVWRIEDSTGEAIFANRYTRTDLWGEPEPIDDGMGALGNPELAVSGTGDGFAVWTRTVGSERNIWTNRYDAETGAWGTPMLLQTGEVTRASDPVIAADPEGNATAIWVQDNLDTGREIIRAIRYDAVSGWGSAVTIASPSTFVAAGRTGVGMDDEGGAIAVWDPPAGGPGDGFRVIMASRYVPGGNWSPPVAVKSDESTSADNFRIDVGANGDAVVVWEQGNGDDLAPRDDIWASRFSSTGWSSPERIDNYDGGDKMLPDVGVDGAGNAYAVWAQVDPDFANIWAAPYAAGSGWTAPELIEPPSENPSDDGDAIAPRVDVNRAGNVFVVWRQVWDQWGSIWSNRRDPGTPWMTAELVEGFPSTANAPTIAVDEARHAHAVWQHDVTGGTSVRSSRFE
ncbi:MAG: Ig-like domain-containing protein [Polyangiales bacterium]